MLLGVGVRTATSVWHDPSVATDLARLHAVFDLAMRIGEGMLSNGAAASEVTATVLRFITSSGIRNVSVTVTFDEVSISYLPDDASAPFTRIRSAGYRVQNFSRLESFETVTEEYVHGVLDLEQATARVLDIPHNPRIYPPWLIAAGLALMGGAAALGLGARLLVVCAATATAIILFIVTEQLYRWRFPAFYVQAIGGFVAALATVLVHVVDPSSDSSIVVVSCLIILLAGLTSLGAMQDAITGWYVTASGRILETLMLTVGLVVGVRGGLLVAEAIGADVSVGAALPVTLASALPLAVSGLLIGLGYAISVQTPHRSLAWCAGIAGLTTLVSYGLGVLGLDRVWSVGLTSLLAGGLAVLLAERQRAPALTFVMAGVVPMVPGSRIYRGLLAVSSDLPDGAGQLFEAGEIAVALAAGAVLGQVLVTRLQRMTGRAVSAFTPVIAAPFTTIRRRRQISTPRARAGRRTATPTGAIMALDRASVHGTDDPNPPLAQPSQETP